MAPGRSGGARPKTVASAPPLSLPARGGTMSDGDANRLPVRRARPDGNAFAAGPRIPRDRDRGLVERIALQHPGLGGDEPRPVGKRGNEAEVFARMLLADETDRNRTTVGIDDRRAEQGFEQEDALGMMPQCAVPGIGEDRLRLVEPLVQRQIVTGRAAPCPPPRARSSALRWRCSGGCTRARSSPPRRRSSACRWRRR